MLLCDHAGDTVESECSQDGGLERVDGVAIGLVGWVRSLVFVTNPVMTRAESGQVEDRCRDEDDERGATWFPREFACATLGAGGA